MKNNIDLGIKIVSDRINQLILNTYKNNLTYHLYGDVLKYISASYELAYKLYKDNNIYIHIDSLYALNDDIINKFNKLKSIICIEYKEELDDIYYKFFTIPKIDRLHISIKEKNIELSVSKLDSLFKEGYYNIKGYYPSIDIDITSFINPEDDAKILIEHINYQKHNNISLWNYAFYNIIDLLYKIDNRNIVYSYKDIFCESNSNVLFFRNKKYFIPLDFDKFIKNKYHNIDNCNNCNVSMFCEKNNINCIEKNKFYNIIASNIVNGEVRRNYA